MNQIRTPRNYVADRRLYLDRQGRVVEADDVNRVELLVNVGGVIPYERAVALGLLEREEIAPGLSAQDGVSVDHPLFAQVIAGGGSAEGSAQVMPTDATPVANPAATPMTASVDEPVVNEPSVINEPAAVAGATEEKDDRVAKTGRSRRA